MLKNSRVSSIIDTNRLGRALARPGMDTRTWVSLAVVTAVVIDPAEGVFADVLLMPSNVKTTCRVAQEYAGDGFGFYTPVLVDDEVLVEAPNGNPDNGLILTRRLYSKSDPPPEEAVDNPDDVLMVIRKGKTMRILVDGGGQVEIRSRDGAAESLAFQDKLNALEDKVNDHIILYNGHIHPATAGTTSPTVSLDTPITPSTGTEFLVAE
jgi:hypothetical protein